jgi:predicted negative regulator of RcsB-dependent stress response
LGVAPVEPEVTLRFRVAVHAWPTSTPLVEFWLSLAPSFEAGAMTKTGSEATPSVLDEPESLGEWLQTHSRQLSIGAIVVVAVGLSAMLWRTASEKKAVEASRTLGEAQLAYSSGNVALAQSDLQKVVTRFGGTSAGLQARLLLAQALYDQKKVTEGLKVLDEVGNPGIFAASFHAIRAAGLEQSSKEAEAAAAYLKAAEASTADAEKAAFKADAARAFTAAKRPDEAKRIWAELAADESNPMATEARMRLGELTAKPATSS